MRWNHVFRAGVVVRTLTRLIPAILLSFSVGALSTPGALAAPKQAQAPVTWTDPRDDAPLPLLSDSRADIVRTTLSIVSKAEYRVTIELAAPPDATHFYRLGAQLAGTDPSCRLFHILPVGGLAKANAFCGSPRVLQSSSTGGAVEVAGNTISATFPRKHLPTFVKAHRQLQSPYSFTCSTDGDCETFIDGSGTTQTFTI